MSKPHTVLHSRLQSPSVETQYPYLQSFKVEQGAFLKIYMVVIMSQLSLLDCWDWMIQGY